MPFIFLIQVRFSLLSSLIELLSLPYTPLHLRLWSNTALNTFHNIYSLIGSCFLSCFSLTIISFMPRQCMAHRKSIQMIVKWIREWKIIYVNRHMSRHFVSRLRVYSWSFKIFQSIINWQFAQVRHHSGFYLWNKNR